MACARPRHQLDLCRIMPRPCISARSPADCCANYSAQLFHPVEVSISQARSPNAVPRRHASPGTRKRLAWKRANAAHWWGKHPNPCHQSFVGYVLAHGTPANPCMKRQTNYIIVIDTCSLRLSAANGQPGQRCSAVKKIRGILKPRLQASPPESSFFPCQR